MTDLLVFYEDKSGSMSLEDIQSLSDNNFQSLQGYVNRGFSRSSFWVRLKIENQNIQVRHPMWAIRSNYSELDYVDFFQISGEGTIITSNKTGNMRPVKEPPLKSCGR